MPQLLLPVTFTITALFAVLLIPITGWVGLQRNRIGGVLRGDGGDPTLFKRIRVHGNLMENVPVFIFTLGAAEANGLGAMWLYLAVAVFAAGRLLHLRLYDSSKRGLAMLITLLPGALMGVWLLSKIWL